MFLSFTTFSWHQPHYGKPYQRSEVISDDRSDRRMKIASEDNEKKRKRGNGNESIPVEEGVALI